MGQSKCPLLLRHRNTLNAGVRTRRRRHRSLKKKRPRARKEQALSALPSTKSAPPTILQKTNTRVAGDEWKSYSCPCDSSDDDVPTVQPDLRNKLDSKDKQSLAPSKVDKDLRNLLKRKSATNENTGTPDLRATISKCNVRRVGQTGDLRDQLNSKADDLQI